MELIGKGGYANVYRAETVDGKRSVAIKVVHKQLAQRGNVLGRFQREAEAASHINHPSVATVLASGLIEGQQPYLVVEYLEGVPLSELIKQRGPMPSRIAVPMFIQIAEGLKAAHNKGIVHRDIKPDNIFVIAHTTPLQIKILDFGLCRPVQGDGRDLTTPGHTVGSLDYMSPEQCLGKTVDSRTDLYSLGYVMWEALTGEKACKAQNAFQAMNFHMHTELPPPSDKAPSGSDIAPALDDIVFKALSKAADERFQSAQEVLAALNPLIA